MFEQIRIIINQIRLVSYRGRFKRLRLKYYEANGLFKQARIRDKVTKLLSQVQGLGELGRLLERDINAFLNEHRARRRNSPPIYELVRKEIEERENKPVIVIQPNHLRPTRSVHIQRAPVDKNSNVLAALLKDRDYRSIKVQSTLKKRIDRHSHKIERERFKID